MPSDDDARLLQNIETLRQDVKYAVRGFRREPAIALVATIVLGLGIGANTAVFSIVNPLLLRALPFPDSHQLVWIANTGGTGLSGATYRVDVFDGFRQHAHSFQEISGYFAFFGFISRTLTGGEPERLSAVDVAPRFFDVLRVPPATGRLFLDSEHHHGGNPRAALLTHGFWQRRFAGASGLVDSTLTINGAPVTVVGILPEDFDFSSMFTPGTRVDMFLPADLDVLRPLGNTLALVGRLKPGVTLTEARAETGVLWPQLLEQHRDWSRGWGATLTGLQEHVSGSMRRPLLVLWAAVGFVLLIVCANLANLLLARASMRRREFAVRFALGARRSRLIRQLLTEGVLLALAGAALGVTLAYGLTRWFTSTNVVNLPLLHYVRVDSVALAVTFGVALVTGLVAAVVPALRMSARTPQDVLQEQGRGAVDSARQTFVRNGLVVAEIALAAILLVGAGLLSRSFIRLLDVDLGFSPHRVVAARLEFQSGPDRQQVVALTRELTRRVSELPGVEATGVTDALPLDRNRSWNIGVPGQTYANNQRPGTFLYVVGPGYFRAMGIELKGGRDFTDQDVLRDGGAPADRAVILNETLARTLYPGVDAVGRPAVTGITPLTIVGVVSDVRQSSLDEAPVAQMYLAWAQGGGAGQDLIVRTSLPPSNLVPLLRKTMADVDSRLIATDIRSIENLVETSVSPRRFLVSLLGGFAVLALLLAGLGVYGVVSYGVNQRMTEIGVRMALGATRADVRIQILADTLRMTLLGTAIGAAVSVGLARVISALLFETSPTDPLTFTAMLLLLGTVATIAGLLPAARASGIDPMAALRAD